METSLAQYNCLIRWVAPLMGWVKLNIDAAVGNQFAGGGLLRDS